jgi:hypothetical protein
MHWGHLLQLRKRGEQELTDRLDRHGTASSVSINAAAPSAAPANG